MAALLLLAPAPLFVFGGEVAPPLRYALLLAATLAVAVREGAAGAVPLIATLLAVHCALYAAAAWGIARGIGWLLAPLPASRRAWLTLAPCAVALALALAFPLYRTPLGPAARANLIGALS
jgi:hypothetical protein